MLGRVEPTQVFQSAASSWPQGSRPTDSSLGHVFMRKGIHVGVRTDLPYACAVATFESPCLCAETVLKATGTRYTDLPEVPSAMPI